MKINAVCPACLVTLTWDDQQQELWGIIEVDDLGCVSVTRGYDAEVEKHLTAHREDGSWLKAFEAGMIRRKENAEHYLADHPADPAL